MHFVWRFSHLTVFSPVFWGTMGLSFPVLAVSHNLFGEGWELHSQYPVHGQHAGLWEANLGEVLLSYKGQELANVKQVMLASSHSKACSVAFHPICCFFCAVQKFKMDWGQLVRTVAHIGITHFEYHLSTPVIEMLLLSFLKSRQKDVAGGRCHGWGRRSFLIDVTPQVLPAIFLNIYWIVHSCYVLWLYDCLQHSAHVCTRCHRQTAEAASTQYWLCVHQYLCMLHACYESVSVLSIFLASWILLLSKFNEDWNHNLLFDTVMLMAG